MNANEGKKKKIRKKQILAAVFANDLKRDHNLPEKDMPWLRNRCLNSEIKQSHYNKENSA